MTKLLHLLSALFFASNVIAQSSSSKNGQGDKAAKTTATKSNKDIETSCSTAECFAGKKLSYFIVYSPECTKEQYKEEVCQGSETWCSDGNRAKLYGSKEKCLELRAKPPRQGKAAWQPNAKGDCPKDTEKCLGTEAACFLLSNDVKKDLQQLCLSQREGPPFMIPNSGGCTDPKAEEERCQGTIAWCNSQFNKKGYASKYDCILLRGLELKAFETDYKQGLIEPVKASILSWGKNVTRNAAIREIMRNGTAEAAQKSIATDMSGFMDKIKSSLQRQTLKNMQSGMRKGLEKYAEQKL
ncbi:hypothetical protein QQS21_005684 [Conoideocrella luteorostrata]|uniref:Uncharacterized protein n=1 Tax=Conoideocrella luteorostrata TaxID=1105319 RepID=A0AAJ0FYY1_9HYPO|nr:hypothetical protein QQS21_005684 [Conoideocrella luteorostrata]